jgi:uncharacterized membrane protein YcaP (DUF421 family)
MHQLNYYFGMQPFGVVAVVTATTVLYLTFTALLHRYGQRLLASPTSFALAFITVVGPVVGRAFLGRVPTLGGGLLALGTLFAIEAVVSRVRGRRTVAEDQHRAVAVLVNGEVEHEALARARVDEARLWSALRGAGIRTPAEVALAVVESNGRFSVLRTGAQIDPAVLTGVRHAEVLRQRVGAHPDA